MIELNFPKYNFNFKKQDSKILILCKIRKKYIILTPEEWVRQNTISFLIDKAKCPITLINVEKKINVNGLTKRYDIVVFKPNGSIFSIVECKAPTIEISQNTFDQIAQYNSILSAEHIMVTNGITHYYAQMDYINKKYIFLPEIPKYKR